MLLMMARTDVFQRKEKQQWWGLGNFIKALSMSSRKKCAMYVHLIKTNKQTGLKKA